MKKNIKNWYKLDNAGTLYSSIASSRLSTVYRMTAVLKEVVLEKPLQEALDRIMPRFPYFNVTLKRGLFWYYYEHSDKRPRVEKESHYPCHPIHQKKGVFPFRVLYYEKCIHLEISHSICDGAGGLIFFKALLSAYFMQKDQITVTNTPDMIDLDSTVEMEEYEDAFKRYYQKNVPPPEKGRKAWHFPFPLLTKGQYLVLTGTMPADKMVALAKAHQCTLTQWITALYFESIQEYLLKEKSQKGKTDAVPAVIAINIPVDLRSFYETKTLRNFFISLNPAIDLRLGAYTRQEIIDQIKGYMALYTNRKTISRYISRNVWNQQFLLLRVIPLWVKRLVMPVIYHRYGERAYTSSISNLGKISLPEEIRDQVEAIQMFPPPSAGNKLKIVMATYENNLCISFGKTVAEKVIERIFFTKIRKMGIPVKIEGNQLNYYEIMKGEESHGLLS